MRDLKVNCQKIQNESKKKFLAISHNVQVYAIFLRPTGAKIWVREKVQPLEINNAFFLEPHTLCYRM